MAENDEPSVAFDELRAERDEARRQLRDERADRRAKTDALVAFLTREDYMPGVGEPDPAGDAGHDWYENHVLVPIKALVCGIRGHDVIPDQCGKPEHDYCMTCMARFPGQAPSRRKS